MKEFPPKQINDNGKDYILVAETFMQGDKEDKRYLYRREPDDLAYPPVHILKDKEYILNLEKGTAHNSPPIKDKSKC